MGANCDAALQKAIYDRLAAFAGLTGLLAGGSASVHDHVPAGASFPYVVIGDAESAFHGTQATSGRDSRFTIHAYSRASGLKEVRDIVTALHAALEDAPLDVAGQQVVLCRVENSETRQAGDGETRHGALRLRIVTEVEI
jgi:hypothetical protein